MLVRVAHRSRPCAGEVENGDRAIVRALPGDRTLLAVIDALGHGPRAAEAAAIAERVLGDAGDLAGTVAAIEAVHRALRATRGAAITLAIAGAREIEVAGVGNVALHAGGALAIPHRAQPGIVGSSLPRSLRGVRATLAGRGRLVLASDGISSRTPWDDLALVAPDAACERALFEHSVAHDDATVLIADLAVSHGVP